MSQTRFIAAVVIDQVAQGHSLSEVLKNALQPVSDARNRAFIQALCFGVCRYYSRLIKILNKLVTKPLKTKDGDVQALILVGLYQLMDMQIAPHAAVAETVNAVSHIKKPWARGLLNAVLREYIRQKATIDAELKDDMAHPEWWIKSIKQAWPTQWSQILAANNEHPPFSLRVNQQHLTRDAYLKRLYEQALDAQCIQETKNGITLSTPINVELLPGFLAGDVSVQDGGAQLAAECLAIQANQSILDACAAPGGKLGHILETETHLTRIVAVEKDNERLQSIKQNLVRLNVKAECICSDIRKVDTWWDGQLFDRILLDAPCSASGVIRRHPDIKLLRRPEDITALATLQIDILQSIWPLLKPGGLLLYATCSIFPQENTDVMRYFLNTHADAIAEKMPVKWGLNCEIGRQILPGMHNMDGFYYALVRKLLKTT